MLNKIILGEAVEEMKNIPDESVDLVLTAPPRLYGIKYKDELEIYDYESYSAYFKKWLLQVQRVLKNGCYCTVTISKTRRFHDFLYSPLYMYYKICTDIGLKPHATAETTVGWDILFVIRKGNFSKNKFKQGHVYDIGYCAEYTQEEYPWTWGEEFSKRMIQQLVFREQATILDCYCGAGTTCYVAKQMGHNYIGIDCSDEAVKISEERLCQYIK